ncbi:MAG: anaerobic ribonucleoside-triphosphate reductase activating protein [Oscillospiraceae bacterium]|nr:anaerobic ribonucleoside-triphosphate reductase activating protein [Oscillospiraceae bacterium]
MKIHGLQKMTLLDFPGRVACTVFLGGCDFRCPFCHNYELIDGTAQPIMDEDELLAFLRKRTGLLDGVAFTGGEPCLHADLPELLGRIRALGFAAKLDTNGFHPDLLRQILAEGLVDYVAMDVKNSPAKYAATCGLPSLDLTPIRESIALLKSSGADYEFRTTVVAELHQAEDFEEIGQMIRGARRYFLQRFTDRDSVPFEGFHAPAKEDMLRYAEIARRYVADTSLRGVD